MKIFIPFKIKDIGGTSSFANKFKLGLEKNGHEVFFEFRDDYDVLFLIVQCPFKYIIHAKMSGKKIMQRLDGCWYYSVSGWKYWLYNLKAKIIYNFFSDYIIYQSNYSKYCCDKFLGKNSNDNWSIIYNGVDLNKFSNQGEKINLKDNSEQKIFFTASDFRREDQIIPILKALEIYKEKHGSNFKFIIAGKFSGKIADIPDKYKHLIYAKFIGKIKNEDLPKYERSVDVFLFTHLNPPCPNNVLEAMACGLPICGINDGSMQELTENNKNSLLLETIGDAFWKKRDINLEKFAQNIHEIIISKDAYSTESRKITTERFSLDNMINSYIDLLNRLK